MKAVSQTEVADWLRNNHPRYELRKWAGNTRHKSLFFDKVRNVEFSYPFGSFKVRVGNDSETIFLPTPQELELRLRDSREDVEKWLLDNAPHIKLLQWAGQSNKKSEFFDRLRNVRFFHTFAHVKFELQKNPDKIFHPTKKEFYRKVKETRMRKGTIRIIDGKTLREIAKEKNVGYTTVTLALRSHGEDFLKKYKASKSSIEQKMESILKEFKIPFVHNRKFKESGYRPDFLVENSKLIIECDGLYWHSDAIKEDKNYHKKKKAAYEEGGFTSLFFRENEILEKQPIIESIIRNKLGKSKRVFARKTTFSRLKKGGPDFLIKNHLMSKGSGRCYVLSFEGEVLAIMQVKWKSLKTKNLEISRFCNKNNMTVVGGFTKLLKNIIETENPSLVTTFIDKRYGSGIYLNDLGFEKKTEHLSFAWTNFKQTFHRMNFRGNSGYENKMFKIWDCGQAKYILKTGSEE